MKINILLYSILFKLIISKYKIIGIRIIEDDLIFNINPKINPMMKILFLFKYSFNTKIERKKFNVSPETSPIWKVSVNNINDKVPKIKDRFLLKYFNIKKPPIAK